MARLYAPYVRAAGRRAREAARRIALVLVTGFATASGSAPASADPVPEDLAALVPAGAQAIVYVPSPAALQSEIRGLIETIAPGGDVEADLTGMLGDIIGPAAASWDTSRPMAIVAMAPAPGTLVPPVTLVLPTQDIAAAQRAFGVEPGEPHPLLSVSGSYFGFALVPGGEAPEGRAAILDEPLEGDIVVRLDVERLMASYAPFVEQRLSAFSDTLAGGVDGADDERAALASVAQGLPDRLLSGLRAAKRLDLSLALDGAIARGGYALTLRQPSGGSGGAADPYGVRRIGAHLPADLPAFLWFAGVLDDWMFPLSGSASTPGAEEIDAYVETVRAFYEAVGPTAAAAGVDEGGFWMAGVADPAAEPAVIESLLRAIIERQQLLRDLHGVHITEETTTTLAGVELRELSVAIDVEQTIAEGDSAGDEESAETAAAVETARATIDTFLGADLRCRYGFVGGLMVYGFGSPAHLERTIATAKRRGAVPEPLARAFDRTALPLEQAMRCDLRTLAVQIAARLRASGRDGVPDVPAGAPVPVTVWNGHEASRYEGGLELDAVGVAEVAGMLGALLGRDDGDEADVPVAGDEGP